MRWNLKHFAATCLAVMMLGTLSGLTGCQPRQSERDPWLGNDIELNVRPSHEQILVGETVTLSASTRNTYGRDVNIEWESAGGELTTEQNGRIARVRFDEPGTFTILSRMYIDGQLRRTEATEIVVRPVN